MSEKDDVIILMKIDLTVLDILSNYCDKNGLSMAAAMEKILNDYFYKWTKG